MKSEIDSLDARILLLLDEDPWLSAVAVARELGVSRNTVNARLQKMRQQGTLGSTSTRIPGQVLGQELVAYAALTLSQSQAERAIALLKEIPEVVEVSKTTGPADFLVRLLTADTTDLNRVNDLLVCIPGVVRSNTSIVLEQTVPFRIKPLLERLAREGGDAPGR